MRAFQSQGDKAERGNWSTEGFILLAFNKYSQISRGNISNHMQNSLRLMSTAATYEIY